MLIFDGVFGVVAFAVWIFCVIDAITTPADRVRNLPKLVWVLLVVLLADIGSIAWLVAGRDWRARTPVPAATRPTNPDDDEEFLASLRARAEEQRRRSREEGQGEPPA